MLDRFDRKDEAALMWAAACIKEERSVWRAMNPEIEKEMLAELAAG